MNNKPSLRSLLPRAANPRGTFRNRLEAQGYIEPGQGQCCANCTHCVLAAYPRCELAGGKVHVLGYCPRWELRPTGEEGAP